MTEFPEETGGEPGRCAQHFSHPAVLSCIDCGAGLCRQCIYRGVDGFARCPGCARPTDILDDLPEYDHSAREGVTPLHESTDEGTEHSRLEVGDLPGPGIPWETRQGNDLVALWSTIFQAITQPHTFTQRINFGFTHYREVLTFGIIMGTFAQLMASLTVLDNTEEYVRMIEVMGLPKTTPVQSFVFMTLPFLPIAATLILALKAGLAHLMARIVLKTERGFGPTLKIVAYAEAASILFIIPIIGPYAYKFLFVFLMLMGIRAAYGATTGQSILVLLPTLFLSL